MKSTNNMSRITIDILEEDHKNFKMLAASLGKSMKELVVESIQKHIKTNKASEKHPVKVEQQ